MAKLAQEKHTQLLSKYSRYVRTIFSNRRLQKTKEVANYILTAFKFILRRFLVC